MRSPNQPAVLHTSKLPHNQSLDPTPGSVVAQSDMDRASAAQRKRYVPLHITNIGSILSE